MRKDNIRELHVTDFSKTVLGPKFGINERFSEQMNPLRLYITGILSPDRKFPGDEANDGDLYSGGSEGEEDSNTHDDVSNPDKFKAGLNSKSRPRSLGISFIIKSEEKNPKISLCLTWARYFWDQNAKIKNQNQQDMFYQIDSPLEKNKTKLDFDEEDVEEIDLDEEEEKNKKEKVQKSEENSNSYNINGLWKRTPRFLIIEDLELSPSDNFQNYNQDSILNLNGTHFIKKNYENESFDIFFRISNYKDDYYKISIYFVNTATLQRSTSDLERKREVNYYIFQPQIRVKLSNFVEKIPFESEQTTSNENTEKNNLKMLYSKKLPFGQGHMCSIVWKEIDPERSFQREPTERSHPFYWLDGDILKDNDLRDKFSCPDIRSEYLPIYQINSPNFDWRCFSQNKKNPPFLENKKESFLDPHFLAENAWNSDKLGKILIPIIEEYKIWIKMQYHEIDAKNEWWKNIAISNIKKHEKILERIDSGLDIILNDFNARLSFCFANKVIVSQYQWNKKKKLFFWRPFQIAFLLLTLKGIVSNIKGDNSDLLNDEDFEQNIVDLIWFPTGGGKTEAYLLVAAFTLAFRRLISLNSKNCREKLLNGTVLLSRYTLRLLTIQQFRRALKMILSADILRVNRFKQFVSNSSFSKKKNTIIGWLPAELKANIISNKDKLNLYFPNLQENPWIWGKNRFSIGLWVGGSLTPNLLKTIFITSKSNGIIRKKPLHGALDSLKIEHTYKNKTRIITAVGDPAQVLNCPICDSILTLPKKSSQNFPSQKFNLNILVKSNHGDVDKFKSELKDFLEIDDYLDLIQYAEVKIKNIVSTSQKNNFILTLNINAEKKEINPLKFRKWWGYLETEVGCDLLSTDILNPGYFFLYKTNRNGDKREYDFEIRCLNPDCELNKNFWTDEITLNSKSYPSKFNRNFKYKQFDAISSGIPISAYTVDEQTYSRLPSMIVATVDKFAQLSYKEEAGTIFGNVDLFDLDYGFYRKNVNYYGKFRKSKSIMLNNEFDPPEIILQDELHLIEGPLGSLVGFYEILIENLCLRKSKDGIIRKTPKYIASTATINAGREQVKSLYTKKINIFPASGIYEHDSFFLFSKNFHPLEENKPGRLFIGLLAPGYSSQIPLIRTFGALLQKPFNILKQIQANKIDNHEILEKLDHFWTIVGYFNAIKELAAIRAICNQDLISWMRLFYKEKYRNILLGNDEPLELSSRTDSTNLPVILDNLGKGLNNITLDLNTAQQELANIVLTTSMFGTGVDISRLGTMVINGQPKSTSSYIQTAGRIGRKSGGLIITFLHAGRPRDLDHYEKFVGYHQALYRFVEPITVSPFAPECVKNMIGPIFIGFLRQAIQIDSENVDSQWREKGEGVYHILSLELEGKNIKDHPLVQKFLNILKSRWKNQPNARKSDISLAISDFYKKLNLWIEYAKNLTNLDYNESTLNKSPTKSVVLGSVNHQAVEKKALSQSKNKGRRKRKNKKIISNVIKVIFENAPNSLRGVEPTITFGTKIGEQ